MLLPKANHAAEEVPMSPDTSEEMCGGCPGLNRSKCIYDDAVRLSDFRPGECGSIVQVCGNPDFRLRMMEMGFVRGAQVQVIKYAPLTDPIEFVIKGYHVSLRRTEAADILMNKLEKVA